MAFPRVSPHDQVRQMYDETAESYSEMMDSEIQLPFYLDVFSSLQSGLNDLDGALLDTSCGSGHMLDMYHSNFNSKRRLIGIDLSPQMVKIAGSRMSDRAQIYSGDMTRVDEMELGPVAGLLSFFAIHHLEEADLAAAFQSWNKTLIDGGILSLAAWEGEGQLDYGDASDIVANRYGLEFISSLVSRSGFDVILADIYQFPEFPIGAITLEARKSLSPLAVNRPNQFGSKPLK